jgi:hypothetical protein
MGRYLAVVAVQTEGRKVLAKDVNQPGGEVPTQAPQVASGDRLVAVVNNGTWQSALDVTYPAAYERVYRRYRDGTWKAMELFFVPEQRAAQLEDGRRVLMNGQPVQSPERI